MIAITPLNHTVPISDFNRGKAGKIFSDVKTSGLTVVMKNNAPECVLLSPDDYSKLIERLENAELLAMASERLKDINLETTETFSLDEVCKEADVKYPNNDEVEFNVYSWDNIEERPLHFELDPKDIIDFVTNDRCDNMYPKLKDKTDGAGLAKAFNEKFHIDAIYRFGK